MEERTEYRLGEEFKFEIKLKCVEENDDGCCGCYFEKIGCIPTLCSSDRRTDELDVIFVEVEEETKSVLKNSHYEGSGIDVIDLMKVSGDIKGFLAGNVLKYVARRNNKGQHEDDIVKAVDYMIMLALEEGMSAIDIQAIIDKRKDRKRG